MRIPLLFAVLVAATPAHAASVRMERLRRRRPRSAPCAARRRSRRKMSIGSTLRGRFEPASSVKGFDRAADALTFETTPLLIDGTLYFATATGKVFALDAAHGTERWRFDAAIDRGRDYSEMTSRGVSLLARSPHARADMACAQRIVFATIDARLFAIDAKTGKRCADFGANGEVALSKGVRLVERQLGNYQVTSPPAIAGDVAVVGSSIGDNRGTDIEIGVVRAFDVRSGRELWHWDPIPRTAKMPPDAANPDFGEIEASKRTGPAPRTRGRRSRSMPSADLVFIPTGSASPDFFGGERPGDDHWADSLVALRASTRRIRLGPPARASRSLGLRHGLAADAGRYRSQRIESRRRRAADQDRPGLRVRARDRRAVVSDRGARGAAGRRRRRIASRRRSRSRRCRRWSRTRRSSPTTPGA